MNLNDILSNNKKPPSLIAEEVDPEKHGKIVATLCGKRKILEDTVAAKGADAEEAIIALFQLKNDMLLFGITEVQYMAYKESSKKKTIESKPVSDSVIEMESLDSTG